MYPRPVVFASSSSEVGMDEDDYYAHHGHREAVPTPREAAPSPRWAESMSDTSHATSEVHPVHRGAMSEPAYTSFRMIFMAAPPNRAGEDTTPGDEILVIDSGGHLRNNLWQKRDQFGRVTKAHGAKGKASSERWRGNWLTPVVAPPPHGRAAWMQPPA